MLSKLKLFLLLLLFSLDQLHAENVNMLAGESKNIGIYYFNDQILSDKAFYDGSTNLSNKKVSNLPLKLKNKLSEIHPELLVNIYNLSNKLPFEIDQYLKLNQDFAITIGKNALLKILASRSKVPVFSLNTAKVTLDRMKIIYSDLGVQLSGIYREQPLSHQLALTKAIQPKYKNIYLLLGILSRYHLDEYEKQVAQQELSIHFKILQNQDSPVAYFNGMSPENGVLILLDNPQQFNSQNIEFLLPSSFHVNIPMIGNRKLHGEIGAIASVYSSENELVNSSIQIIVQFFRSGKFHHPSYLDNFSVFINQQVAQNFNFVNLDENQLEAIVKSKVEQLKFNQ